MEHFAELFNKLQGVLNVVGGNIDFPQIVVVGSQSDGKSSVLEGIVKKDFLPRGTGVVTRTPIILQLRNTAAGISDDQESEEYAVVSYGSGAITTDAEDDISKKITDFEQVGPEILAATEKIAGGKKNIVRRPITVKLFSPTVPDLTLVDLPGLIENRAGDQPSDIKEQVESLVRSYIENPQAIILAVHPATADLANGKSLNIAHEVDPEGKRTVCIITKLDVDTSVSKRDLIDGTEIAHHHAKVIRTIGVVNRSSVDQKKSNWTHADQRRKEESFFQTHYRDIAADHGTEALSECLAILFREHIRRSLPKLKTVVDELQGQCQKKLQALGENIQESLDLTDPSKPDPEYSLGSLAGDIDQGDKEVRGGARIEEIFNEFYWNDLERIVPLEGVGLEETWTRIRTCWGTERQMFLSAKAFRLLVRIEIERMEKLSIRCVSWVHQALLTIRNSAGHHIRHIREQFPKFYERINTIVADLMELLVKETEAMVQHSVTMQLDYINVKHPDFAQAQFEASKKFNEVAAKMTAENDNTSSTNVTKSALLPKSPAGISNKPGKPSYNRETNTENFSESESDKTAPQQLIGAPRQLSPREQLECELTMELVRQYFTFIRRIVRDSVPKVIIRFLVNRVKDQMMKELLVQLGTRVNFSPLLKESENIASERKSLTEKLERFRNGAQLIVELEAS